MQSFQGIHEEALSRLGSSGTLKDRLPLPASADELRRRSDREYFSLMSRRIFRAGLRHSMVDAKWPAFEQVFYHFDIERVRLMSDEELEALMHDRRLIRHWAKIKAVRTNAQAWHELLEIVPGIGAYLADWPADRITGLWADIEQRFKQMGGHSGPYFLRMAGKDTFLLTDDVIRALIRWDAIREKPAGGKSLLRVQEIMNRWSQESGRPLCQVSMILALSVD